VFGNILALQRTLEKPIHFLMLHAANIKAFLGATTDQDPLVRAYCGLVAIELVLKHEVGLKDHNVCAGLGTFRTLRAIGNKSWSATALISFADGLRRDIVGIHVNDKFGQPKTAPHDSFPYIRYVRFNGDGWPPPHALLGDITRLADTVQQLRIFLRTTFGLPL
jgi:hypothetical protein